ncbi:putative Thioesterase domain, HotDog domain superfamily [Dioscorea sansibarensis]
MMNMTGEKQPSPASITAKLDRTLHTIGFQYELVSPERIVGRLQVTETCCQPFDVLSGGVSALMAESMASLGGYVASGFKRVAGVQLATNHLRPALLGDIVEAEARPMQAGKTIQVWEVHIWKIDPKTAVKKVLVSTSKITLLCNRQAPEDLKGYEQTVKSFAKL